MNVSFLRINSSRESTQRFMAALPWRIPIPYGCARKRSFVSFEFAIGRRDTDEARVVPHHAPPPALVEGKPRVREVSTDDQVRRS